MATRDRPYSAGFYFRAVVMPQLRKSDSATIKWWDKVMNQSLNVLAACDADIDFMLAKIRGLGIS